MILQRYPCVCGHPSHTHSRFHDGRCTATEKTGTTIGDITIDYPCTCAAYQPDDGTDGSLSLGWPTKK